MPHGVNSAKMDQILRMIRLAVWIREGLRGFLPMGGGANFHF